MWQSITPNIKNPKAVYTSRLDEGTTYVNSGLAGNAGYKLAHEQIYNKNLNMFGDNGLPVISYDTQTNAVLHVHPCVKQNAGIHFSKMKYQLYNTTCRTQHADQQHTLSIGLPLPFVHVYKGRTTYPFSI